MLHIIWEIPLPSKKVVELLRQNNGHWTEDEKIYYGLQIVKDIEVPNY